GKEQTHDSNERCTERPNLRDHRCLCHLDALHCICTVLKIRIHEYDDCCCRTHNHRIEEDTERLDQHLCHRGADCCRCRCVRSRPHTRFIREQSPWETVQYCCTDCTAECFADAESICEYSGNHWNDLVIVDD